MAEKTPGERALEIVREAFNKRSKKDRTALPLTSAVFIQDSEDSLWRNNPEDQNNPEDEVQEHLTPQVHDNNHKSDEEELGLLTQYIGSARGQKSSKPTKTSTSEAVELDNLKEPSRKQLM